MSEYEYPLSTGRSNILGTEAFRNLLGQSLVAAKKEVIILSAYIKLNGIKWLEDNFTKNKIKCTIIARWDKGDLAQGSSDLECYELCKKNKWNFRILKDLHAKIMIVDQKDLFIGSPNLTGSGMNLVPVSNKEMGVKLEASKIDIKIINNLIEESIIVDDIIYEQLKIWKKKLPKIDKIIYPTFPSIVQRKLTENYNKLWVHNFPWSNIDELINAKNFDRNIKHDMELFGLDKDQLDLENIRKSIIESKVYKWLINQIKNQKNNEIYFGTLSSIIHNSLLDDPKPYRKNVKDLQANLFSFIKKINFDNLEVSVPFSRSERIKLI